MKKEVLLLIPAHNEEESIGAFLDQLREAGAYDLADILVVNDHSTDNTVEIALQHGVTVISSVYNIGYGSALQLGYKHAAHMGYRFVIQLDADGQHDACNVMALYRALNTPMPEGEMPDIVIGSRFAAGSRSFKVGSLKRLSIHFFQALIHRTTGTYILDPTSGLQGLSRRAFTHYAQYLNFDNMYPDANMIVQMLMLGFNVIEVPSVMHERKAGVSMHAGILRPLIYMMVMPLSVITVYLRLRVKRRQNARAVKGGTGNVQA